MSIWFCQYCLFQYFGSCIVIFYCGFNFPFPNCQYTWTCFHMIICHKYIPSSVLSVHVLVYFLIELLISLTADILELYSMYRLGLCWLCVNVFSYSVACLFIKVFFSLSLSYPFFLWWVMIVLNLDLKDIVLFLKI